MQVGDQCQLPPVVQVDAMRLAGAGFSLFERLLQPTPAPAALMALRPSLPAHEEDGFSTTSCMPVDTSVVSDYDALLRRLQLNKAPRDHDEASGPICNPKTPMYMPSSCRSSCTNNSLIHTVAMQPFAPFILTPTLHAPRAQPAPLPTLTPAMLAVQYRMHPDIAEWSSRVLYAGMVRSGTHADLRKPPRGMFYLFPLFQSRHCIYVSC
jgi:hypothetical protein